MTTILHVESHRAEIRDEVGRSLAITSRPQGFTAAEWLAAAMAWGATIQAACAAERVRASL